MKHALADTDLVQESGPERQDFKIKLFADIDAATPPNSIIASRSSGLAMSIIQSACRHPERCVIGHPFNPPHMIPLVEVVAGTWWKDLGTITELTSQTRQTIIDGVLKEAGDRSVEELEHERDRMLLEL